MSFQLEPFTPARSLQNPHLQSILANSLRPKNGVNFRRQRLETPDGDFVDLDFADVQGASWAELGNNTPIVLLLHGLEGSARRGYAHEAYKQLAQRGIRSVGLNFRSCSGEMNRTAYLYHAGATQDVALVMDWLNEQFPSVGKGMIGFSLGANVLLKYLGENGKTLDERVKTACPELGSTEPRRSVKAAVAVSPPFDMVAGSQVFSHGTGKLYARLFLRSLKEKTRAHANLIDDKIDIERVLQAQTVAEFDDALTAPLHGFTDVMDYYEKSRSGNFLPSIQVPTLLLRSLDDPFFADDVEWVTKANNANLITGFTRHGGHVGFMEGVANRQFWAERQAARFFALQLLGHN